jgi:hypothetical protein
VQLEINAGQITPLPLARKTNPRLIHKPGLVMYWIHGLGGGMLTSKIA